MKSVLAAGPVSLLPDAAAAVRSDAAGPHAAAAGHGHDVAGSQPVRHAAAAAAAAAAGRLHRRPAVPGRQHPGQPDAADAAVPVICLTAVYTKTRPCSHYPSLTSNLPLYKGVL